MRTQHGQRGADQQLMAGLPWPAGTPSNLTGGMHALNKVALPHVNTKMRAHHSKAWRAYVTCSAYLGSPATKQAARGFAIPPAVLNLLLAPTQAKQAALGLLLRLRLTRLPAPKEAPWRALGRWLLNLLLPP